MNVLVLDDEPLMLGLLEELLSRRGHEVVAVSSAEAAWTALQGTPFPLMVLDWVVPGEMDGLDLCRRVRASSNGDRHVVLVMTARHRPADLATVLDAGADDYIAKPFGVDLLNVRLAIAERQVDAVGARVLAEEAARDRARLEGALVAATTVEHYLGNQLQKTMGFASLLADDPDLPLELQRFARSAVQGVRDADATLRRLLRITRLEENDQLAGHPIVDLERSSDPDEPTDPSARVPGTDRARDAEAPSG
jgi:DNA-binding response OmpR family regulator